jgi:hypothetical protein
VDDVKKPAVPLAPVSPPTPVGELEEDPHPLIARLNAVIAIGTMRRPHADLLRLWRLGFFRICICFPQN